MEKAYWLGRKQASLRLARNAASSEARLAHYDLAGRYGLKAMSDETSAEDQVDSARENVGAYLAVRGGAGNA